MKFKPKMARLTMQDRNVDIQEGTKLRNVRRRLFQDDDENERTTELNSGVDDNLANRFFEEARKSRENAKERWNFDFEKEEPLPGRYEWVKLDAHGNEIRKPKESDVPIEDLEETAKANGQNGNKINAECINDETSSDST